ncbi:MAG: pentapeptide repeat-containing protein, partial [Alphaproteobacteria bacterium]|nr:pentapeptide repeat-containing protein [Alphaproteobacteria bacterium]
MQGVALSLQGFLIASSLVLVVQAFYLHIFYDYWHELETLGARHEGRIPTIFNLTQPASRLATELVFYWWVPFTFLLLAFKAAVRAPWAAGFYTLAVLSLVALIFMKIRRCSEVLRRRQWWRWLFIACLISSWPYVVSNFPPRPLDFSDAELPNQRLIGLHLVEANFQNANLERSDLRRSNLDGANFRAANLRSSRLDETSLRGALFDFARLERVSLSRARLAGASFHRSRLMEADLGFSDLVGA